ncbi:hypothetical protein [Aquisediminimonas profunda]|uniref:hypothetical protein n=1 Tax=Aquisediminimonas profunda TaxID=1550733 RepID=UPI001C63B625|nr:hypothetical protein [Aquisediminimonas profunda]
MRSRLPLLATVAWLALAGFGILEPVGQAWSMPGVISICSGGGTRLIEIPEPGNDHKRPECAKGCHALCQRKRGGLQDSSDAGD